MSTSAKQNIKIAVHLFVLVFFTGCRTGNHIYTMLMEEQQISFTGKNHALDNNDNFSPDDKYLCYDTRGTVFNDNLANSKSIEKIELSTGSETVLWEPESITGEQAAPGVAAVSWHPAKDKVIFIHGPFPEEVEQRGYYNIRNRTGVEVSAYGKGIIAKPDYRDVATNRPTLPGAHRGGTHRHEYSKNGNRIGFTYDDYLLTNFDRTIGYMEPHKYAPAGYTHYFAVLLKPAVIGKSLPNEIEKAYGDSWVDKNGTMRAFIGKVRAENGVDYYNDLFIADVPIETDITTAYSGNSDEYPEPPAGVVIRRLTYGYNLQGIVRGSSDGRRIAFLAKDTNDVSQVFICNSGSTQSAVQINNQPVQLTHFNSDASFIRWHPTGKWILTIVDGHVFAIFAKEGSKLTEQVQLTKEEAPRTELVVANDGNTVAYNIKLWNEDLKRYYSQIFIMKPDWKKMEAKMNEQ